MRKDLPKFKVNFPEELSGIFFHFLPFSLLVTNKHDRDLAIQLLGFRTRQAYIEQVKKDKRWATMLAIIITLFSLDNPDDVQRLFNFITFKDKILESRLAKLCGIEENTLSVEELEAMWNVSSLPED
tara:strand:- start:281 stop:661 length:381 start_codon:yes stop_codon:yes gene_type:complete